MTSFEIAFGQFERSTQSDQLKHTFDQSIENIFETLETAEIDMNPYQSMIEPIVNINFGNTFHHQNVPNQRQRTNENASQKYHQNTPIQQYQHKNTGQPEYSQQYQPRYFQRNRTSSIPYLKENCLLCGLNNKGVRELLIQHDGTIYFFPFRVPLYIHSK